MTNKQDYLAKKEQNKRKKLSSGLISEKFPKISSIVINMQYYQKLSERIFMVRTVNFSPSSYAYFYMDCLTKNCLNGGFEFSPVISGLIKKRKKAGKGKFICNGKNDSLDKGHVNISYTINIKYNGRSR
jgi:hypothetical protein